MLTQVQVVVAGNISGEATTLVGNILTEATRTPQAAVRQHPELAGTYLNLRAAELAAQRLRDPEDQKRFVSQVRSALADGVQRGDPLQPVRLRERTVPGPRKNRAPLSRG